MAGPAWRRKGPVSGFPARARKQDDPTRWCCSQALAWGGALVGSMWVAEKWGKILDSLLEASEAGIVYKKQLIPICPWGPGKSWEESWMERSLMFWSKGWVNSHLVKQELNARWQGGHLGGGQHGWPALLRTRCLLPIPGTLQASTFRCNPGRGGKGETKLIDTKFLQPQRNGGLKREKVKKELHFRHTWICGNKLIPVTCDPRNGLLLTLKKRQKDATSIVNWGTVETLLSPSPLCWHVNFYCYNIFPLRFKIFLLKHMLLWDVNLISHVFLNMSQCVLWFSDSGVQAHNVS